MSTDAPDPRDLAIAHYEQHRCTWDEAAAAVGGCTAAAARARYHRLRARKPAPAPDVNGVREQTRTLPEQKAGPESKLAFYEWMVRRARRDIRFLRSKKPEAMAAMYKVLMEAHDRYLHAQNEQPVRGDGEDGATDAELEQVVAASDNLLRLARE